MKTDSVRFLSLFSLLLTAFVTTTTIHCSFAADVSRPGKAQRQAPVKPARESTSRANDFIQASQPLVSALERLVREGTVVGAQLAVGDAAAFHVRKNFGVKSPGSSNAVNDDTLFCIGSCSKPLAATCVMALTEEGTIGLEQPIDRWLPRFGKLKLEEGRSATRAPTVRELLAHRAGLYSQKEQMTPGQGQWIRNFNLTLAESVEGIAGEPLLAQPGEQFAYSGAGYCVLGRVAEVAAGKSFEELLQQKLGRPLDWRRTTYFPKPEDKNVAAGSSRKDPRQPDPRMPHALGTNLRLPLTGGSLYSTATETGQFARMMLRQGRGLRGNVFSEATWKTILQRPYPGQNYGLGWGVNVSKEGTTTALSHNGALYSARSTVHIQLPRNVFVVVHYTLASDSTDDGPPALGRAVQEMMTLLRQLENAR